MTRVQDIMRLRIYNRSARRAPQTVARTRPLVGLRLKWIFVKKPHSLLLFVLTGDLIPLFLITSDGNPALELFRVWMCASSCGCRRCLLDWFNICLVNNNALFSTTTQTLKHLDEKVWLEVPSVRPDTTSCFCVLTLSWFKAWSFSNGGLRSQGDSEVEVLTGHLLTPQADPLLNTTCPVFNSHFSPVYLEVSVFVCSRAVLTACTRPHGSFLLWPFGWNLIRMDLIDWFLLFTWILYVLAALL